ncbi:PD-(D/E)XK motif protein [Edaphobacillus lindanitolerans]|uniref:Putative PD-(D/E)XK family member n=1 Tax=Edaphobacillus lindanitolerans TaxID=550447 RepID=A0A1U7PRI6_9BACI|nr:PD-(D/E)XK motif protein [Edaphobacillus lindanitolerans]SIT87341.1 Putative PD-(D/E)XK family member [Edaphobacillus lindanitolerans]
MKLVQEIRNGFASLGGGMSLPIEAVKDYPAFVLRIGKRYGVAIEVPAGIRINERFSNARYATTDYEIFGKRGNYLFLSSEIENLRNEFANICAAFVDPGENGTARKKIEESPLDWWEQMRELLGNRNVDSSPYNVLGELITYYYLIKQGKHVKWTGQQKGTVDFESKESDFEVKSTTMRYDSLIQINSQFQLQGGKEMKIFFLRFEESESGRSIDDIVSLLAKKGVPEKILEDSLASGGYEPYSSGRNRKYRLHEMRRYNVDENFPLINKDTFKEQGISDRIIKINYTVDLGGMEYDDVLKGLFDS